MLVERDSSIFAIPHYYKYYQINSTITMFA